MDHPPHRRILHADRVHAGGERAQPVGDVDGLGAKYLFPGIAGAEIINFTHWLGALVTSMRTIGIKDTPIRRVIHRAATFVDKPILCLALVMKGHDLHGLYIGAHTEAWGAAADLSAQL